MSLRRDARTSMQCQNCHKNPAQLHFTNVQDNRMTEVHLCRACAEERGLVGVPATPKFSIADLLASMVDKMSTNEEERVGPVQCPACGMHYSAFKETARLGCADCYATFTTRLRPLLRRVHGSTRHVGKAPAHQGDADVSPARALSRLHDELTRAVEREDFESAAEIRDRIKEMERRQSGAPAGGGGKA
jgi:protein arginine kinase activator